MQVVQKECKKNASLYFCTPENMLLPGEVRVFFSKQITFPSFIISISS
ncbi:Uncharacterized protein dnm_040640 [Desulfonema magnum]|uniref:Uncharacterized protein n=1 Tax=Desulfonema magnum TaxID=45655 RepID=A0A975BLR2_9BACT|nr:Uncharacterized protein dnm_040640 [Desulfonema magnum]